MGNGSSSSTSTAPPPAATAPPAYGGLGQTNQMTPQDQAYAQMFKALAQGGQSAGSALSSGSFGATTTPFTPIAYTPPPAFPQFRSNILGGTRMPMQ